MNLAGWSVVPAHHCYISPCLTPLCTDCGYVSAFSRWFRRPAATVDCPALWPAVPLAEHWPGEADGPGYCTPLEALVWCVSSPGMTVGFLRSSRACASRLPSCDQYLVWFGLFIYHQRVFCPVTADMWSCDIKHWRKSRRKSKNKCLS